MVALLPKLIVPIESLRKVILLLFIYPDQLLMMVYYFLFIGKHIVNGKEKQNTMISNLQMEEFQIRVLGAIIHHQMISLKSRDTLQYIQI